MDTLYYSNNCKHSQRVLHFLVKGNLADKINFLCIDKRRRDPNNNQIYIHLENGQRVIMPPNVHSVPALLLVKQSYRVVLGDDIIQYYQTAASHETKKRIQREVIDPVGTSLMQSSGGMNITSEAYTMYNLTPDELSAKGSSGVDRCIITFRQMMKLLVLILPQTLINPIKSLVKLRWIHYSKKEWTRYNFKDNSFY